MRNLFNNTFKSQGMAIDQNASHLPKPRYHLLRKKKKMNRPLEIVSNVMIKQINLGFLKVNFLRFRNFQ